MRVAVDTGGTFTDCVVLDGAHVRILKVFSTPEDSSRGILEGVQRLAGDARGELLDIIHGTTVGTNSLLERRGARVALVTTSGFEDLIEIGRQNRPRLYDLNVRREPPLVARSMRWGVPERVSAEGSILARPSPRELNSLAAAISRTPHAGSDSISCKSRSWGSCACADKSAIPSTKIVPRRKAGIAGTWLRRLRPAIYLATE